MKAMFSWWQVAASVYNFALWGFIAFLISSEFLGIVWDSSVSSNTLFFGQEPWNPPTTIAGFNDEIYSDRAFVCMAEGRAYAPMQLSQVLDTAQLAPVVNGSADAIRVVKRRSMTLSPSVLTDYARICDRLDVTLSSVQASCDALGFNITQEVLRVVDGVTSETTVAIKRALPIVVVPFWDNAAYYYYVIPSEDGAACVFQLEGTFQTAVATSDVLFGVPRSVRTGKTEEWLQKPGGQWRHGWYEDTDGQRWFANMMTTQTGNKYGIVARRFDLRTNRELNCSSAEADPLCAPAGHVQRWGNEFKTSTQAFNQNQVFVSNSTRFGLFMFTTTSTITLTISYSLETFISNVSVFGILVRWLISLLVMLDSYRRRLAPLQTTGIGCLSSSRTFNLLPIMLLPRLKNILVAFFTVGCFCDGAQRALSEAWFAMYPAIVELMLYYYSLLNIIAKVTHRRMSDALFGPTLLFFCALHHMRFSVSDSSLFQTSGRITTYILPDEVDSLTVGDFFITDAALRFNGYVVRLFALKLVVLALNLLPLVFSENMTKTGKKSLGFAQCEIERALAVRASHVGGLGLSEVYTSEVKSLNNGARGPTDPTVSQIKTLGSVAPHTGEVRQGGHALASYELNRLGYLVFGGKYLLSYDDWYILTSMAPFRVVEKLWNCRINVFEVTEGDDGALEPSERPRICRLDDADLHAVPFHDISVRSFR